MIGTIPTLRKHGKGEMVKLNKRLDPLRTGLDAEKLQEDLRRLVIGQEEAVEQIVNIYQTYLAGLTGPGRPIGSFLFLGPTGTGKTRLVEATAESMLGNSRAVIKIDCAEFQHSHEIAKLIGSPPGYLGHRETHPLLSQEVLSQYQTDRMKISFVLFDEIEKASDALWNLLLGVLDKATLTLGDNRRVDFSRTLIFMTSNLGASEMGTMLRPSIGFSGPIATGGGDKPDDKLNAKVSRAGVEAARRKFTPEFMNRIDKVVVFRALGSSELEQILTLELNQLQQRVFQSAQSIPFIFRAGMAAREFLLREGTDAKYGARHLKRAIERTIVHPLSNLIASAQVRAGDLIGINYDETGDCLTFTKEAEDIPAYTMVQMMECGLDHRKSAASTGMEGDLERRRAAVAHR